MLILAAILLCQQPLPDVHINVQEASADMAALTKRVDALTERVAALTAKLDKIAEPAPPQAPQAPPAVIRIFGDRCGTCHISSKTNETGFTLFAKLDEEGVLAKFTPKQLLAIDQQVYSGDCPKGDDAIPVPTEEYSVLRVWINESKPAIMKALK